MTTTRLRSTLWAAYGDALGFITELTNASGVKRRLQGEAVVRTTVAWRRRVGGQFGVQAELPAGMYSDDTQLRMATARAIRGDGTFDVEAFAKVELTVWPAYALGGGRGTRAAAVNLAKPRVTWLSNFFDVRGSNYMQGGGNGVAMRVQPHVWSSAAPGNPETFLFDVLRNAVCTHGHPRAMVGAAFHAASLGTALQVGMVPSPDDWEAALDAAARLPEIAARDDDLARLWLPEWERRAGRTFESAYSDAISECRGDLSRLRSFDDDLGSFEGAARAIGATSPEARGSGAKTPLLASYLAWVARRDTEAGLLAAANLLDCDTDTIATMAGAILGVAEEDSPSGAIVDKEYLTREAERLAAIARGRRVHSFTYPDLLRWVPPKSQLDVVKRTPECHFAVAGLGAVTEIGAECSPSRGDEVWQWMTLAFGETLFIKRRRSPGLAESSALPALSAAGATVTGQARQPELFDGQETPPMQPVAAAIPRSGVASDMTLHDATKLAWSSGLDPSVVGSILFELAKRPDGVELAMGFAAVVAKAAKTQSDRDR